MAIFETTILLLTFLLCLSLVWSSLRTGITPVPSSRKARQEILNLSELAPTGPIIELGSGWGQLAVALAKKFPEQQVVGYELSPLPWLVSVLLKHLQRVDNLTLERKSFLTSDIPPAALIVCYLYPGGMSNLADKILQEKPQISMLISNTFALPEHKPAQVIRIADLYKSPIYLYRFKLKQPEQADG